MTVGTSLLVLLAWCVLSVIVGLVVGPLLGRLSDAYPKAEEEKKR